MLLSDCKPGVKAGVAHAYLNRYPKRWSPTVQVVRSTVKIVSVEPVDEREGRPTYPVLVLAGGSTLGYLRARDLIAMERFDLDDVISGRERASARHAANILNESAPDLLFAFSADDVAEQALVYKETAGRTIVMIPERTLEQVGLKVLWDDSDLAGYDMYRKLANEFLRRLKLTRKSGIMTPYLTLVSYMADKLGHDRAPLYLSIRFEHVHPLLKALGRSPRSAEGTWKTDVPDGLSEDVIDALSDSEQK